MITFRGEPFVHAFTLPAPMRGRVEMTGAGCWLWTGALTSKGYGSVSIDGVVTSTHRAAWVANHGPVPDGLQLDHLCEIKACCNPAHLEPVTAAENMRRMRGEIGVTRCRRGHPLTGQNLYLHPRGQRVCRTCRAAHSRAHRRRQSSSTGDGTP